MGILKDAYEQLMPMSIITELGQNCPFGEKAETEIGLETINVGGAFCPTPMNSTKEIKPCQWHNSCERLAFDMALVKCSHPDRFKKRKEKVVEKHIFVNGNVNGNP